MDEGRDLVPDRTFYECPKSVRPAKLVRGRPRVDHRRGELLRNRLVHRATDDCEPLEAAIEQAQRVLHRRVDQLPAKPQPLVLVQSDEFAALRGGRDRISRAEARGPPDLADERPDVWLGT